MTRCSATSRSKAPTVRLIDIRLESVPNGEKEVPSALSVGTDGSARKGELAPPAGKARHVESLDTQPRGESSASFDGLDAEDRDLVSALAQIETDVVKVALGAAAFGIPTVDGEGDAEFSHNTHHAVWRRA